MISSPRASSLQKMSESENKASVQHTPAEWVSSNQDHYINADKAKYNSEKVLQSYPQTFVFLPVFLILFNFFWDHPLAEFNP